MRAERGRICEQRPASREPPATFCTDGTVAKRVLHPAHESVVPRLWTSPFSSNCSAPGGSRIRTMS